MKQIKDFRNRFNVRLRKDLQSEIQMSFQITVQITVEQVAGYLEQNNILFIPEKIPDGKRFKSKGSRSQKKKTE